MNTYEVGCRTKEGYFKFMDSPSLAVAGDYFQSVSKIINKNYQVVLTKKDYELLSTTPLQVSE